MSRWKYETSNLRTADWYPEPADSWPSFEASSIPSSSYCPQRPTLKFIGCDSSTMLQCFANCRILRLRDRNIHLLYNIGARFYVLIDHSYCWLNSSSSSYQKISDWHQQKGSPLATQQCSNCATIKHTYSTVQHMVTVTQTQQLSLQVLFR